MRHKAKDEVLYGDGIPQLMEKVRQLTGTGMGKTTVDKETIGRIKPNKFPAIIKKLLEG